MTPAFRVRAVDIADLGALVPLVRRYWDFEHMEGFDETRVTAALRRRVADTHMAGGWIAMADDRPVGYLLAVYVFSLEHLGLTAEIDEFYVVPERRGSGVGAALLQAAEAAFVEAGCTNVSLQVGLGNGEARAFYERRGYTPRDGYELLDKALPARKEWPLPTNDAWSPHRTRGAEEGANAPMRGRPPFARDAGSFSWSLKAARILCSSAPSRSATAPWPREHHDGGPAFCAGP